MRKKLFLAFTAVVLAHFLDASSPTTSAATNPPTVKTLNTAREFPPISSADEWRARAKEIREQILVSAGLWPMPEKTPLHTHIFAKVEREGYSVEKAYFQTLPGFYLAGNLYRPLGHGKGPFPGVLNPHGHWKEGRLTDTKDGSVPARCISFARQGMVAFSYDMVGFNDTHFADSATNLPFYDLHRQFGTNRSDQLWGISLMGLQTWNSLRALDFLESLPDVDRKRLACTGESGGGTQTFMLGAIDDRLAAQAPVVMVSHSMQGGCSCENMPGLRVEYSNMEIAAAAAPRPQILVAATGDWTKTTLKVEGPAIGHIYELLKATEKLRYVRFDYGHNYNQTSREAVYEWFGEWLLKSPGSTSCKEAPYQKEADADLRVFPNGELPKDALTREQMILYLKKLHRDQWQALVPQDKRGLKEFKKVVEPAWRHSLQVLWPLSDSQLIRKEDPRDSGGFSSASLKVDRNGKETLLGTYWTPTDTQKKAHAGLVVLQSADGVGGDAAPVGLPLALLKRGLAIVVMDYSPTLPPVDQLANFYTTYNRTLLQQRVRDLTAVCAVTPSIGSDRGKTFHIILVGQGRVGIAALLTAPAADAVIVDCDQLDVSDDEALLAPDLFCPGMRNVGTFEGPAMLGTPHPLLLHNTGSKFRTEGIRSAYKAANAGKNLRIESRRLSDEELINWISKLN
jgi:hypothetical protein